MQRDVREHSYYLKLENKLREDILSGVLPAGRAIPGELELCREFALSRTTVRKAIQRLVDRNFLRKAHGAGTFVIPAEERAVLPRQLTKIRVLGHAAYFDPEKMDEFDKSVFLGASSFAKVNDCTVEWCSNMISPEKLLADYHNFLFDGIIWVRASEDELPKAKQLSGSLVPQTLIARDLPGIPGVYFDSERAMNDLCHFMKAIGHQKICFIDLKSEMAVFMERQKSFLRACEENQVRGALCAIDFFRDDIVETFLREKQPTALLCASPMEPYFRQALERYPLAIPDELTFIRLGPVRPEYSKEACAELRMPIFEMGRQAAETLCACDFRTQEQLPKRILVPGEIVVGRTITTPNRKVSV